MAIQVGRANAVVASTDTVGTNIDVNVGFTPTSGQWFVLVCWSGRTEATDTVGASNINAGVGFGASSTARRGSGNFVNNTSNPHVTSRTIFDDGILKVLDSTDVVVGALDLVGEVTNGIRFTVDDQFPADVRFQVVVIDGLSGVGIFNILEPAATGNTTHTGAGVDNADLFFFLTGAQTTSVPLTSVHAGLNFGAAHADGQFVVSLMSRDAQNDTYHYNTDQECLARVTTGAGAAPNARASFVATAADGITLNWLEVGGTNTIHFAAALKGIEATVSNGLTQTDTTTSIAITGLGNTCLGGLVVSNCEAESTQDTPGTHLHWSIGSFTSTTNRGAHGAWDQDAVSTESSTAVEYDEVYANISSTDTIQGLMDVSSLDATGATFIMDDADPAQKWFGVVLFANSASDITAVMMPSIRQYGQLGPVMLPRGVFQEGLYAAPTSIQSVVSNDFTWLPNYPAVVEITYEATPSGEQV